MRAFRLSILPMALAVLLGPTTTARADILFETTDLAPALWPWPAAVAEDQFYVQVPGVVWASATEVLYTYHVGPQVYEQSIVGAANVGAIDALAAPDGSIYAAFRAQIGQTGLRFAERSFGGEWSSEWVEIGSDVGASCAVGATDLLGPVVAFVDATVSYDRRVRLGLRGSLAWEFYDLDTAADRDPRYVSLATDGNETIHVAWCAFDHVRYCQGIGAPVEEIATTASTTAVSIALGRDDRPRVAFLDSGSLHYALRDTSGWSIEPVLPHRRSVMEMDMAMGYEDVPHIVFVTDDPDDPPFLATEFLGAWREQPLTTGSTLGIVQRPSIAAGNGAVPSLHLVAAWNGAGLQLSHDLTGYPAFAVAELRASPLGDLVSTVDLYSGTQYLLGNRQFTLDFTAAGVRDTVDFCQSYRDTLRRRTDATGTATFRMPTGGAVHGGIAIRATRSGVTEPLLVESSLPLAGPDLDGNGSVTAVDRDLFDALLGSGDPRGDIDHDGIVGEDDLQVLLDRLGESCTGVSVDDDVARDRTDPMLEVHPNPSAGQTAISWSLPESRWLSLTVHDLAGRCVRRLHTGPVGVGRRSLLWDGRDDDGHIVGSGVYVIQLRSEERMSRRRVVIVR